MKVLSWTLLAIVALACAYKAANTYCQTQFDVQNGCGTIQVLDRLCAVQHDGSACARVSRARMDSSVASCQDGVQAELERLRDEGFSDKQIEFTYPGLTKVNE